MSPKRTALPQHRLSRVNVPVFDYRVYHLTLWERVGYALLALVVAGALGYLFFGGLAVDENGHPTNATYVLDALAIGVPGIFGARYFLKLRAESIQKRNVKTLERQFRDVLDSLSSSLAAGGTVIHAFQTARDDLEKQYSPDAPMVTELNVIIAGFHNNVRIEEMVADLGERSGSKDIESFAEVFTIAYTKGADMKQAVHNTHLVLSEKMSIAEEIETSLVASKNESFIMVAIPIVLVTMLKTGGGTFAESLRTPVGVVCTLVALALFIAAYSLARKIMTIKF